MNILELKKLSSIPAFVFLLTPTLIDSPGLLVKVKRVRLGQGLGGGVWDRGPVQVVLVVVGWVGGAVGDNGCRQAGLSGAAGALLAALPLLQHLWSRAAGGG